MSSQNVAAGGPWKAKVELQVPFYDIDPMEVVWHGHYAKYFERARRVLLDAVGYGYEEMKASGFAWPVIDMHIRYLQPMTLGQRVIVHAEIVEWEDRLKMHYRISDAATAKRLTKGWTVQVGVNMETKLMCLQSPPILFKKLGISAK